MTSAAQEAEPGDHLEIARLAGPKAQIRGVGPRVSLLRQHRVNRSKRRDFGGVSVFCHRSSNGRERAKVSRPKGKNVRLWAAVAILIVVGASFCARFFLFSDDRDGVLPVLSPDGPTEIVLPRRSVDDAGSMSESRPMTDAESAGPVTPRSDALRSWKICVVDHSDRPIRGASVLRCEKPYSAAPPTDGEGRTVLEGVTPGDIRVEAEGHRTETVALPIEPSDDDFVVRLLRRTRLIVKVRNSAGEMPRLLACIREGPAVVEFERTFGLGNYRWAIGARDGTHAFFAEIPDSDGIVLPNIRPGVPFRLEIIDHGEALASRRVVVAEGEHREELFNLAIEPKDARFDVVDGDGQSVPHASVVQVNSESDAFARDTSKSNRDGHLMLAGVLDSEIAVTVHASGFMSKIVGGLRPPGTFRVVLDRSRPLDVVVTTADGEFLRNVVVSTVIDQRTVYGVEKGPGKFRFDALPTPLPPIRARFAGRHYPVPADIDGVATVVIPRHGALRVVGDFSPESAPNARIVIDPLADETPRQTISVPDAARISSGTVVVRDLFPGRYAVFFECDGSPESPDGRKSRVIEVTVREGVIEQVDF